MRSQVRVYREPCLGSDLLLAYVMHNPHPIGLISCFPPPPFFFCGLVISHYTTSVGQYK